MKTKITYLVQGIGLIAAAVGLVLIMDHRLAVGLLILGGLAWYVAGYVRLKDLF